MKATSGKSSDSVYTSGNLQKYETPNPVKRLLVRRMQERVLSLARACLRGKAHPRILDAGSGEGLNAALLAERMPEAGVTLLDASREALDYARTICPGKCVFECGPIESMPFEEEAFDLVLCTEVLEHLRDPAAALRELIRVSSGYVLISVPLEPWFRLGNLMSLKNIRRLGNPPDHLNHWSRGGFKRWMRRSSGKWAVRFSYSFPWQFVLLKRDGRESPERKGH